MSVDRVEIHNQVASRTHEPSAVPADAQTIVNGQPQGMTPVSPTQGDRPEWLPPKFQSPEDLAQAYVELESR
jgi:hypothetical protein